MADTDKPKGECVQPPTVPIRGVNTPDPTAPSEPEGEDPGEETHGKSDDPDKASEGGHA